MKMSFDDNIKDFSVLDINIPFNDNKTSCYSL